MLGYFQSFSLPGAAQNLVCWIALFRAVFMASIARKNLFEDIPRFLVAQAGILFAVSLVTIQTGLLRGFMRSTTLLVENSRADIWVSSEDIANLDLTLPIPYERVAQARGVRGVARAEALLTQGALWRDASDALSSVKVIGFEPDGQLLSPGQLTQGSQRDLSEPYSVILDTTKVASLGVRRLGDEAAVNSRQARLAGLTSHIQSSASSPFLFASLETANAYVNSRLTSGATRATAPALEALSATDSITYVLVQAEPGEDLQALQQRLEAALPDTRAYTRAQMASQTQAYWQKRTSIGLILGLGAVVGVVVGIVIVSQILYSSVSDHLKEFGTLKAMGASNWVTYSVIIEQALWMSVLGYLPGMALCLGVAAWTSTQGVLILITPALAAGIFGVTVVMCVGSALFAIQKVTRVDPAIVFKA